MGLSNSNESYKICISVCEENNYAEKEIAPYRYFTNYETFHGQWKCVTSSAMARARAFVNTNWLIYSNFIHERAHVLRNVNELINAGNQFFFAARRRWYFSSWLLLCAFCVCGGELWVVSVLLLRAYVVHVCVIYVRMYIYM